jgi:hypothetical protein
MWRDRHGPRTNLNTGTFNRRGRPSVSRSGTALGRGRRNAVGWAARSRLQSEKDPTDQVNIRTFAPIRPFGSTPGWHHQQGSRSDPANA